MSATCRKCGEEHLTREGYPACVGHKRKTGEGCRGNRVSGTTLCSKHGGLAPQTRRKGAERVAAAKIAATHGDLMEQHRRPGQHPYELLAEVTEGMAVVLRMVQQRLADLSTAAPDEDTRAEMNLYRDYARALAPMAKMLLDADIDERIVQLEEAKIERLFGAVMRGMRAANLTFEQQDAVRAVLADDLLGDLTPEERQRWQAEAWERHQQPYRVRALRP